MIPVERVTELLLEHAPIVTEWGYWVCCECTHGNDTPGYDYELHAQHQAGVLAGAGLIPTQREWGVEDEYSVIGFGGNEHAARTWAEGGTRPVVSRWTGATEWESA